MIDTIRAFIAQHNLIPEKTKVVVGLSGGPDSIFLLHVLVRELHVDVIAAHLDHEWRDDSYKDAAFCREIAKKYNVPLVNAKISELSTSFKFDGSLEDVGRRARRFFFETVRTEHNADLIALAHHAQDQQETFFIRLVRGASLTGLAAIKPKAGRYIRPLLTTNKRDIVQFLDEHDIPYLTDPSNESEAFLRNRIRKNVLPALRACDNRFEKKFEQTIQHLQDTEQFLEQLTRTTFAQITTTKNEQLHLNARALFTYHPVLQHRLLVHWLCTENVKFPVSRGFFTEMLKFLGQSAGGTHTLHPGWKIVKQKGEVFIKHDS